jgi:hypothetical protein
LQRLQQAAVDLQLMLAVIFKGTQNFYIAVFLAVGKGEWSD